MKLNLGCGLDIKKDYVNADYLKYPGVDMMIDLNKFPWKINDNSFSEVVMTHVIEHLEYPINVIKELWRVTINRGIIKIRTPHFSTPYFWRDLTHKRPYAYGSFDEYDISKKQEQNHINDNDVKTRFRIKTEFVFPKLYKIIGISSFANKFPRIYEQFFAYILPCREIYFELIPIK